MRSLFSLKRLYSGNCELLSSLSIVDFLTRYAECLKTHVVESELNISTTINLFRVLRTRAGYLLLSITTALFNRLIAPEAFSKGPGHIPVQKLVVVTTGMRHDELLALYWEDVDFEKKVVFVHRTLSRVTGQGYKETEPKTKSSR